MQQNEDDTLGSKSGKRPEKDQDPEKTAYSSDSPGIPELSDKKYRIYGLLIVLFALTIRLFHLGERVFHHDESVHGSFTLKLLENGEYSYNPAYHGPFLYHSTALVFHFLGINDTTSRLIPVLLGVAAVLALFLLKKELGKRGVLWTAFLLSFSPSMVYFSRFFRNDMIIVFCTLAVVAGVVRYLEKLHSSKRLPYLILIASSLAIAVTAKENAYLIILIFGAYAGLGLLYRVYSGRREKKSILESISLKRSDLLPLLTDMFLAGVIFTFIVMLFYTSLFRNEESILLVVERAFNHWTAMHRMERIGGPFYYYLPILLTYEAPILLFGITGFLHFLKKKGKNTPFFLFLCYWALTSLLLYSYLQEKVPWLVVHIVLPSGILAGAYLGEMLPQIPGKRKSEKAPLKGNKTPKTEKRSSFLQENAGNGRILLTGVLVFTLIISLGQCISVNFYRSMEPAELMTHTQSSPDIRELLEKIEGFNRGPETIRIYVVEPGKHYWPLPWYLKDYEKTAYSTKTPLNKRYDAIIVPASYQMYREIPEEDYSSYNFTLRPGKDFTLYYDKRLEKTR